MDNAVSRGEAKRCVEAREAGRVDRKEGGGTQLSLGAGWGGGAVQAVAGEEGGQVLLEGASGEVCKGARVGGAGEESEL